VAKKSQRQEFHLQLAAACGKCPDSYREIADLANHSAITHKRLGLQYAAFPGFQPIVTVERTLTTALNMTD
jgi:hypothetical protein